MLPASCWAYFSALNKEAVCSSEMSADFHQTTCRYILEDRNNCSTPRMDWVRVWMSPRAGPNAVAKRNSKLSCSTTHFTASKCTAVLTSKNCTRAVALQTMVISRMLYRGTPAFRIPGRPGIRIITAVTNNMFHFIIQFTVIKSFWATGSAFFMLFV
jgi:hypothetical protein